MITNLIEAYAEFKNDFKIYPISNKLGNYWLYNDGKHYPVSVEVYTPIMTVGYGNTHLYRKDILKLILSTRKNKLQKI